MHHLLLLDITHNYYISKGLISYGLISKVQYRIIIIIPVRGNTNRRHDRSFLEQRIIRFINFKNDNFDFYMWDCHMAATTSRKCQEIMEVEQEAKFMTGISVPLCVLNRMWLIVGNYFLLTRMLIHIQ